MLKRVATSNAASRSRRQAAILVNHNQIDYSSTNQIDNQLDRTVTSGICSPNLIIRNFSSYNLFFGLQSDFKSLFLVLGFYIDVEMLSECTSKPNEIAFDPFCLLDGVF